jgi:hypothetical protein
MQGDFGGHFTGAKYVFSEGRHSILRSRQFPQLLQFCSHISSVVLISLLIARHRSLTVDKYGLERGVFSGIFVGSAASGQTCHVLWLHQAFQ